MDLNSYQWHASETAVYPSRKEGIAGLSYCVLGLNGEAGEVAEKLKKIIRDNYGEISKEHKEAIKKELGDVLWYVSQCAEELGLKLDDVGVSNIDKLYSRKERGKIQGNGDNR